MWRIVGHGGRRLSSNGLNTIHNEGQQTDEQNRRDFDHDQRGAVGVKQPRQRRSLVTEH